MLKTAEFYFACVLIIAAFFAGWRVEDWRFGAGQTKVLASQIDASNKAIANFNASEKQTQAEDTQVGQKLDTLNLVSGQIQKEVHSATLTVPILPGCANPFAPAFLRILNNSPTASPAEATTTGQ